MTPDKDYVLDQISSYGDYCFLEPIDTLCICIYRSQLNPMYYDPAKDLYGIMALSPSTAKASGFKAKPENLFQLNTSLMYGMRHLNFLYQTLNTKTGEKFIQEKVILAYNIGPNLITAMTDDEIIDHPDIAFFNQIKMAHIEG